MYMEKQDIPLDLEDHEKRKKEPLCENKIARKKEKRLIMPTFNLGL